LIDAKGKRRLNILVPTDGDPVVQRFDDQGKPLPRPFWNSKGPSSNEAVAIV